MHRQYASINQQPTKKNNNNEIGIYLEGRMCASLKWMVIFLDNLIYYKKKYVYNQRELRLTRYERFKYTVCLFSI